MNDDENNESDVEGKKGDKPVEDTSELDKLKARNDAVEKELIRGRELKAEGQKLEAEEMLGGDSDAGQTQEPGKEETPKEYKDRILRGEDDAGSD